MTLDANDIARKHGADGLRRVWDAAKVEITQDPPPEPLPPTFADEALALRFAELHANDLRYVALWSKWLYWTGSHWHVDDTLLAFSQVRAVCRQMAAECNNEKIASNIASAKTVAAVERLARADRRLAASVDQWDCDPWLLNTPSGVTDLRTGKTRQHNPADHLIKITAASPRGNCQTWLRFLDRVTAGDRELQSFIQRLFGYALTGDTSAQALFFIYGTGANGKSVCIDTVAGILGDYHRSAPIETFTASTSERHPTDLAGLRGARLVTAIETEEGRRWAESRIKSLTGGDKIAARFMRQDFFEFIPQFKLVIAGNHKPGLRSVDEAIRRRFHLLPFTVTIPPEERDPDLRNKLKSEWPGILQWLIEGCVSWQKLGLRPASVVDEATAAYLEAEDALSAWIDECCIRNSNGWASSNDLFASWKAWADRAGEFVGSAKRFTQNLETRGFLMLRKHTGRGFSGLEIDASGRIQSRWNEQ